MKFIDVVGARRSVRAFEDRPIPRVEVERAIALATTAPAPHHSSPWRFVLVEESIAKEAFSAAMGTRWREDLRGDGVGEQRIEEIVSRSHGLLISTPLLTVCCADMERSQHYPDEARELAEWTLFAHSVGAALQTYMLALADAGIASCWISAPVFCRDIVKAHFGLPDRVEPHALVLAGYAHPGYRPRPRPEPDIDHFILRP